MFVIEPAAVGQRAKDEQPGIVAGRARRQLDREHRGDQAEQGRRSQIGAPAPRHGEVHARLLGAPLLKRQPPRVPHIRKGPASLRGLSFSRHPGRDPGSTCRPSRRKDEMDAGSSPA
jgi:hypothetical protein